MRWLILIVAVPLVARAQWFVGAGPLHYRPESADYRAVNRPAWGGTVLLMSRQYCHWWYGARLEYSPLSLSPSRPTDRHGYTDAAFVAGELRWFPWMPTSVPLYGSIALGLSTIATSPSRDLPSRRAGGSMGFGYSVGIGGVLFYDSPCCGWWLDVALRYHAPNAIVRSKYRPVLSSVEALVTFNYGLGGSNEK
ncbi:MAG: hypothetical protein N2971_05535 [Chlorobi bacterium]|nr:hypothetical protein [Chlorobiota bacterium]